MSRQLSAVAYAKCCACGSVIDLPPNPPAEYVYACSRECAMRYMDRHEDDAKNVRWPSDQLRPTSHPDLEVPAKYDPAQIVAVVIVLSAFTFAIFYLIGIVRGLW